MLELAARLQEAQRRFTEWQALIKRRPQRGRKHHAVTRNGSLSMRRERKLIAAPKANPGNRIGPCGAKSVGYLDVA